MKKILLIICLFTAISCSKDSDSGSGGNNNENPPAGSCGTSNGYTLYKDADGCYYSDGYGSKVYVADDLCNC